VAESFRFILRGKGDELKKNARKPFLKKRKRLWRQINKKILTQKEVRRRTAGRLRDQGKAEGNAEGERLGTEKPSER